MSNFNLKKAAIYQTVKWARTPVFRFAGPLKKLFLVLFILFFLVFLYGFLTDAVSLSTQSLTLGLSIVLLCLFSIYWLKESFLNSKLKNPKIKATIREAVANPEEYNLAEFLSFDVAKAVFISKNNSTLLFYNLLKNNPQLNFIFPRALLNLKEIKKILKTYLKSDVGSKEEGSRSDFEQIIYEAVKFADGKEHSRVEVGDIICALAKYDLIFKKILIDTNLKVQDIENLSWWLEDLEGKIKEQKRFWDWKNLSKKGSLGKEWAAGYTITLDQFSIDISEIVRRQGFPEIIGHKTEIAAMERILSRQETNNVLIVGEPGSGRKGMLYALAKRSMLGESLPEVNFKRVVQLDLSTLLAQTQSSEEVANILDGIFREVISAGNVILAIDELHNFVGGGLRPGVIDISGILAPYLPYSSFQIVAITSFEGLHKNIEENSSLLSLFEKVEVAEISERETLMLLEDMALKLEFKYKKFVSYPALRDIIVYCSRYMAAAPFPEKAMDLLDEAMVLLSQTEKNDRVLMPQHIARLVSEKTQIPVGEMQMKERETLINLEKLIHERIINQQEAVNEVSSALRRARAEVSIRKGPMGSFLFLGPTGVGKTETSKALAEIYFGSEERMIRLDMSEFQNITDIARLLGSSGEEGLLTTKVREAPFSLILLDEIEKAHPNILNLFLQVLDEGYVTDGMGRKVDFRNSIIIATSNAGYQIILKALKEEAEWSKVKTQLLDRLFEEGVFRPEFINRFDGVIVFKPLSKENLLDIVGLMLKKLKKNLQEKEVEFVITESLKEKIVELGYDPTFGAREIRRVIQDKVENVLASALLSGEIKRGSKVEIEPEDFTLLVK